MYNSQDTIAAIATPAGTGGIAVIRISGERSFAVADTIFRGQIVLADANSHTIHYGTVNDLNSDEVVDTVLASVFRNPHSFTGENVVEISSHGGYFVTSKILALLLAAGARSAEPGEFTLRAFLNGKIDLAQAEAVSDIIRSKTEIAHRSSVDQLSGKLSAHITDLRKQLLDLCSLMELELDFSQEGIELTHKDESLYRISKIQEKMQSMIDSYKTGKLARDGVKVAIAGRPNAGKSSLLNVLLEEERAIVSEIPGTTRDTIEESIILDGMEFLFIDTAGLRESVDVIEKEGIRRTIKNLQRADIVLFILDASNNLSNEDIVLYKETIDFLNKLTTAIYVVNKIDVRCADFDHTLLPPLSTVEISCKNNIGISELKRELVRISMKEFDYSDGSIVITNIRHKDALTRALDSLKIAENSIKSGLSGEFVAVDLRDSLNILGEILGITTPEDILNNIFSQFCIGK